MKVIREFAVFIVRCLPLLILSCSISNGGINVAEGRYRTGVDLQEQGRLEEAIAAYNESINLDPQLSAGYAVYNNRSRSYAELDQHQRAIQDLDEAIRLIPQYAAAYNNRGRSYAGLA